MFGFRFAGHLYNIGMRDLLIVGEENGHQQTKNRETASTINEPAVSFYHMSAGLYNEWRADSHSTNLDETIFNANRFNFSKYNTGQPDNAAYQGNMAGKYTAGHDRTNHRNVEISPG
jgi:hypothetical protein